MTYIVLCLVIFLSISSHGYRPLQPQVKRHFPPTKEEDVGTPLYLTPYIDAGDVETGREMARVDSSLLQGLDEEVESYSGFLTVDEANDGNMFFWFFPAEENPETAPVVIWLEGGPGESTMFGLLKLHGPILTTVDEDDVLTGVGKNPYSWGRKHNVLYVDNPVGSGFSYSNKLPTTQDEVTDNLYEMLQQWFKLFPMYQSNPFYPFGESYAGKYVPSLSRRIHEMNMLDNGANIYINLAGMGIGDGWMSPYHQSTYGNMLYQVGLLDAKQRDVCLNFEDDTKRLIDEGKIYDAWMSWATELDFFMTQAGCSYLYAFAKCQLVPSEDNFADFCNLESTRQAIHVGTLLFHGTDDVYNSMAGVIMETQIHDVVLLLDAGYKILMYDGNFDIIVNHSGVLNMLAEMEWSGKSNYLKAPRSIYYSKEGDTVGYLTSSDSLRLLLVRNAGHEVPMWQPKYAQQMIEEFTSGAL